MKGPKDGAKMVDMALARIVIREGSDQQYIFLQEQGGGRGFPIVIGTSEACEIRRVVAGVPTPRPLTHQLAFETIRALGTEIAHVDIVDLRDNTFFAQIVLHRKDSEVTAVVDARPSDAVALALRAQCPIRVAESVLDLVRTDPSGPDPLRPDPDSSSGPESEGKPEKEEPEGE
ncbi:MAG: bifunctional nuclease family protein [Planctomycetota bacterium]